MSSRVTQLGEQASVTIEFKGVDNDDDKGAEEEALMGAPAPSRSRTNSGFKFAAVGMVSMIVGVVITLSIVGLLGPNAASVSSPSDFNEIVSYGEVNSFEQDLPECVPNSDWTSVSSVQTSAGKAVEMAFQLAETARQNCSVGKLPPLPWEPEQFLQGAEHTHYVHIHHKYDSSCQSESYRLQFYVAQGDAMDNVLSKKNGQGDAKMAVMEVNKHKGVWKLLASEPNACSLQSGSASAPVAVARTSKATMEAAKFGVRELSYAMSKANCLPAAANTTGLEVAKVRRAISSVVAGYQLQLLLEVTEGEGGATKEVALTVFERCARASPCIKQLRLDGNVCDALQEVDQDRRRLFEEFSLGAEPDDATEIWSAQRRMLMGNSQAKRNPLMERYIKTGAIAASHNPEQDVCHKEITVYNQGSCGSCYANGIAQMIGIRLCNVKRAQGRRLAELEEIPPPAGMHPFQVKAALLSAQMEPAEPRDLSTCSDSPTWSIFGQGQYSCAYFSKQDAGCKRYKDYGQRTHCKKACNTCPVAVTQESNANPWYNAHYEFMPSVNDLAQCANSGGKMQGCDGGNSQGVWNNWMQNLNRPLWRMGNSCKPYTMKCKSSGGVVNPLSGGACSKYAGYETWHKPCSCIPSGARPSQFQCPAAHPSAQCGVEVPPAMYIVKSVAHGLSIAESVKNMQRHIAEFGPIYVSFATTNEFMHHNWKAKPVYTGGSTVEGGHAVVAVGWGTHAGTAYSGWIWGVCREFGFKSGCIS